MLKRTALSFTMALLTTGVTSIAQAAETYDPFARDIKILADWFEGEFDNSEQLWFENFEAAKVADENKAERLHTTHWRLDLPAFGDHVFYVEEYAGNDPDNIIRQRFVTFKSDLEENAIRMTQGFFRDTESVLGGKNLDAITTEDLFFIDTCDVFWHRRAGQFEGRMKDKACVFGDGEKRRYSVHDLTLSADKYWRADSTYLVADDSFHVGTKAGHPLEMRKANRFTCDVTFRPEDMTLSFEEFRAQTQEVKGLSIHSEGGSFQVTRERDDTSFTYLMREKEYPFYAERPEFIYFSIKEEGANRSTAFTVNDIASRRLGGQFGGLGFNCYRDGYDFMETNEIIDAR